MKTRCLLFIFLLLPTLSFGQGLNDAFSNPTNRTDEEMAKARDFVHTGARERVLKEGCASINDCQQPGEDIEDLIGKAYGMLGMVTGGGLSPQLDKKPTKEQWDAAKEKGPNAKPENDKQTDYCMMAAMAYEAGATLYQQSKQQSQNNAAEGDPQLQALISLREIHKTRENTAYLQSGVYGAVTACYGYMWTQPSIQRDWKLYLKMGGAAALTGLYIKKALKHRNAKKDVEKIISSLDGVGKNCNPWTKTECFCKEKTSQKAFPQEYQEVCILNEGNPEAPKVALGCLATEDKKVKLDKECKCKGTNSCLRSPVKIPPGKLNFGSNLMAEANKTLDLLGKGEFDKGSVAKGSLQQAAIAKKLKVKEKKGARALTLAEKKTADELSKYMSPGLASMGARSPSSSFRAGSSSGSAPAATLKNLSDEVKKKLGDGIDVAYKSGNGGPSSNFTEDEPEFTMPGLGGPKEESAGMEVVSFAEKAMNNADVSNSPTTPIFDIISNRYRVSGWNKLEPEEEKEATPPSN